MPLYDFKCAKCNHVFELIVDAGVKITACAKCYHPIATRQLSAPGSFQLKGDGFYKPSKE